MISPKQIQERIDKIHGSGLITLINEFYRGGAYKARFIDKDFGEFESYVGSVLKGTRHPSNHKITADKLQERIDKIHGTGVITLIKDSYVNTSVKARFIDKDFGEWVTSPWNILEGSRHPSGHKKTVEYLQKQIDQIHGKGTVILIKDSYIDSVKLARFVDKDYGEWTSWIGSVLKGRRHFTFEANKKRLQNTKYFTSNKISIASICDQADIKSPAGFCRLAKEYSPDFVQEFINLNLNKNGKYKFKRSTLEFLFFKKTEKIFNISFWNKKPLEAPLNFSYRPDFRLINKDKILYIDVHGLIPHTENFKDKRYIFNYHYDRSKTFKETNISLLEFYQDEIQFKFPIVLSMIKSRLGLITNSFPARKLELKENLNADLVKSFLNQNHLMGYKSGKAVGLFQDQNLICLLSYSIWKDHINVERFCTKLETSCPGGFSKLVTCLKKFNLPIQSFCDLRYSNGRSYEATGFENVGETIGFCWTDGVNRFNRLYCKATTEKTQQENAIEKKLFKIYDAGQRKYSFDFSRSICQ